MVFAEIVLIVAGSLVLAYIAVSASILCIRHWRQGE